MKAEFSVSYHRVLSVGGSGGEWSKTRQRRHEVRLRSLDSTIITPIAGRNHPTYSRIARTQEMRMLGSFFSKLDYSIISF